MLGTLLVASQTWKMFPSGAFLILQVPREKYFPQVCNTAHAGLTEVFPMQCDVTGQCNNSPVQCDVTVLCNDSLVQCDVTMWCDDSPVQCDVPVWCDVTVWCNDVPVQCDVTVQCDGVLV